MFVEVLFYCYFWLRCCVQRSVFLLFFLRLSCCVQRNVFLLFFLGGKVLCLGKCFSFFLAKVLFLEKCFSIVFSLANVLCLEKRFSLVFFSIQRNVFLLLFGGGLRCCVWRIDFLFFFFFGSGAVFGEVFLAKVLFLEKCFSIVFFFLLKCCVW